MSGGGRRQSSGSGLGSCGCPASAYEGDRWAGVPVVLLPASHEVIPPSPHSHQEGSKLELPGDSSPRKRNFFLYSWVTESWGSRRRRGGTPIRKLLDLTH